MTPGAGSRDYCTANPGGTRAKTYRGSLQVDYEAEPFTITSITAYCNRSAAVNAARTQDLPALVQALLAVHRAAPAAIKGVRPDLPVGLTLAMFDAVDRLTFRRTSKLSAAVLGRLAKANAL